MQGDVLKKDFYDFDTGRNLDFNTVYTYDNLNKLSSVQTQYGSASAVLEGQYKYYANGKVQRLRLGTAHGVDYTYNERDWLQMINQQNINGSQDPGHDSTSTIPCDRFGEVIGYNIAAHIGDPQLQDAKPQFNGNISWQMYQMSGVNYTGSAGTSPLVGNSYAYDNVNRLDSANFGYYVNAWQKTNAYDGVYAYDNVGNFTTLKRFGSGGSIQDSLNYTYGTSSNRLFTIGGSSSATYRYDVNSNIVAAQDCYSCGELIRSHNQGLYAGNENYMKIYLIERICY